MPDSQDSLYSTGRSQDSGLSQRVSLYGKGTTLGDTALPTFTGYSVAGSELAISVVDPVLTGLSGTARVASTSADGASTTNGLYVWAQPEIFNGATWDRLRTPNKFNHAIATAAGNTAVWTPAAGKKFRLMRFAVGISGGTLLAVAGIETITFQDSASGLNGVRFDVQVPSTVVTGEEYFSGWIDWGNGFLSAAANNVLNVNLGTATTAGGVTVMVAGTEE